MTKVTVRTRIDFAAHCSIGPGKVRLLEGIARSGSLSAAARTMGMSYRRAWLLVRDTNEAFEEPVAEFSVGGREGGGAQLTAFGQRLVADYRRFEAKVQQLAAGQFPDLKPTGRPARGQGLPRPLRRERQLRTRTTRTPG